MDLSLVVHRSSTVHYVVGRSMDTVVFNSNFMIVDVTQNKECSKEQTEPGYDRVEY